MNSKDCCVFWENSVFHRQPDDWTPLITSKQTQMAYFSLCTNFKHLLVFYSFHIQRKSLLTFKPFQCLKELNMDRGGIFEVCLFQNSCNHEQFMGIESSIERGSWHFWFDVYVPLSWKICECRNGGFSKSFNDVCVDVSSRCVLKNCKSSSPLLRHLFYEISINIAPKSKCVDSGFMRMLPNKFACLFSIVNFSICENKDISGKF